MKKLLFGAFLATAVSVPAFATTSSSPAVETSTMSTDSTSTSRGTGSTPVSSDRIDEMEMQQEETLGTGSRSTRDLSEGSDMDRSIDDDTTFDD